MNSVKKAWINLVVAPLWFIVAIIILSFYYVGSGMQNEEAIALKISSNTSLIILIVQVFILTILWFSIRKENFHLFTNGWKLLPHQSLAKEILIGVTLGATLAVAYFYLLSPLQIYLQTTVGDYVPVGSTMSYLGSNLLIFFIANVVFAPFVEESLYRNYALSKFLEKYSTSYSIIVSSLFFGLLHWMGGIWYIILTALVVGVPFAIIATKRKSIVLVFIAHFMLNLVEFIYVALQNNK